MINGLHHAINERTKSTHGRKRIFFLSIFQYIFFFLWLSFYSTMMYEKDRKKTNFQRSYANQVNRMQSKGRIYSVYVCTWKANNGEFSYFFHHSLPRVENTSWFQAACVCVKWMNERNLSDKQNVPGKKRYDLIITSISWLKP